MDVSLTTSIAIAQALNLSYTELAAYYDNVTEKDITAFVQQLATQNKLKGKGKKATGPSNSKKNTSNND